MEIILNEEDLKKLITSSYKGVTGVRISVKKLKVILTVDSNILQKNEINKENIKKIKETIQQEPQEEVLPIEARMGLMRSGNEQDRAILRIG